MGKFGTWFFSAFVHPFVLSDELNLLFFLSFFLGLDLDSREALFFVMAFIHGIMCISVWNLREFHLCTKVKIPCELFLLSLFLSTLRSLHVNRAWSKSRVLSYEIMAPCFDLRLNSFP